MGRVVVTEFITIDGVVEDPGGSEDKDFGGWAFAFDRGDEGNKFKGDEQERADAMLLGRVTYEGFAEAWPSREGEFADKFNNMKKYVVSSTLTDPEWTNSEVVSGDLGEAVERIRGELEGDVIVHGSVQLAQELLARGLVDELRLMVYPTVLGAGKKLFGDAEKPVPMELAESGRAGETQLLVFRPKSD